MTEHCALVGVMGWPVSHSLSPRIHGHWLRRLAIEGAYLNLPVAPQNVAAAVAGLRALGFWGANVTVPHKQAVLNCCDRLDASARAAGAVNTLRIEKGAVIGSNTDGAGFLRSLAAAGVDPRAGPVLLLGSGGAARGIAAALLGAGAAVIVTSRNPAAAVALAADVPGLGVTPWSIRPDLGGVALLVNATTGGMVGQPPLAIALDAAGPALVVADIVYAPRQTALLQQAAALGLRGVEGIGMLLHQAALAFEAWFGVVPPVDAALLQAVLGRGPDG